MVYEEYFLRRLLEELDLAEASNDLIERETHERACRHFGLLLESLHSSRESERLKGVP